MSNNTIYGAAVVMVKDKLVYLCRRTEKVLFPKKWQIVNGRLKHTEQSMVTAVRIVEEQTTLKIDMKRLHFVSNVTVDETNEFYYVYAVNLNEDEIPLNTNERLRDPWRLFPLEKACVLDVVCGVRPVIRALERTRRKFEFDAAVVASQIVGPPPPTPAQHQQIQQLSEEHIRQQLTHGECLHLDNMHAKMHSPLGLKLLPF